MNLKLTLAAAAALLLTMGCLPGGGDGGGPSRLDMGPGGFGVDPGNGNNGGNGGNGNGADVALAPGDEALRVDELDEDQRRAICTAFETVYADALGEDALFQATCAATALAFAAFFEGDPVANCEMVNRSCLDGDPEFTPEEDPDPDPCPLLEHPMCTATIGEIDACIQENVAVATAFAETFECTWLNLGPDEIPEGFPAGSPACDALEAQCPGFMDSDDEVEEVEPVEE